MTLLVSLYGAGYTVLLADRRISAGNQPLTDESNKATAITFDDATLAVAFTGLAQFGNFCTADWLLEALLECGPPDFQSVHVLHRLREAANRKFREDRTLKRLSEAERRLAFIFGGFCYDETGSHPVGAILTNFSGFAGPGDLPFKPDEFVLRELQMDAPTRVGFAGAWPSIRPEDVSQLNNMLEQGKPAGAVIEKAVSAIHAAAESSDANNTVGGQINSITIWADRTKPIDTAYHVRESSAISYSPNWALLTSTGTMVAKGGMVFPSDNSGKIATDAPPIAVPKVHRNAPCPCGSRIRYRNCHGKRSYGN